MQWLQAVDKEPTKANIPAPAIDPTTTIVIPIAQYALLEGPYGDGGEGDSFNDDSIEMIPKRTLPLLITIKGDKATDGISVGYKQPFPDNQFDAPWHGGGVGGGYHDIQIGPGEKITMVNIKSDDVVKRVTIQTNKKSLSYPNSDEGDRNATCTCDQGTECFLGFAGRAHTYTDGLQVKYMKFSPAVWKKVPDLSLS